MWNGNVANNGDNDDGESDSGMSENIHDDDDISNNVEPLNMDVVNHILNQQLGHDFHYHNFAQHRFEADDDTLSVDSGADLNESKDDFNDFATFDLQEAKGSQEVEWNVDHIISDPTIIIQGIANEWISFDNKVKTLPITYKILPYLPPQRKHKFNSKLEYMLNVVIPKLHQHEDSDIFIKLKPKRIHSDLKEPFERSLCIDLIEQRLIHCFYPNYAQCLHDFESLFFHNTFPAKFYDATNKNSIAIFFRKLLQRLPHEEKEMPPPVLKNYSKNLSITSEIKSSKSKCKKRKLSSSTSDNTDEAIPLKRALIIPTHDLLLRFQSFSPSK